MNTTVSTVNLCRSFSYIINGRKFPTHNCKMHKRRSNFHNSLIPRPHPDFISQPEGLHIRAREPLRLLRPWPDQYLLGFYSHAYCTFVQAHYMMHYIESLNHDLSIVFQLPLHVLHRRIRYLLWIYKLHVSFVDASSALQCFVHCTW